MKNWLENGSVMFDFIMPVLSTFFKCRMNLAPKPFWLNFAVTYRCNARCQMCGIWRKKPVEELSLTEIEKLFSEPILANVKYVMLTGGEPFLREDLPDLVSIIFRNLHNPRIVISSNGLATRTIIKSLRNLCSLVPPKNLAVGFSLDGIGKTHDLVRGIPGAFTNVMRTLKSVRTMNLGLARLGVGFTLMKSNISDIFEVYDLSKKIGVGFDFGAVHESNTFYANVGDIANRKLDRDDIDKLSCFLKQFLANLANNPSRPTDLINYVYYKFILKYLVNPKVQPIPCFSGIASLFIQPNGDVNPCIFMPKIGNIRENTMVDILFRANQTYFDKIRRGRCPNCWSICEVYKNIVLNSSSRYVWKQYGEMILQPVVSGITNVFKRHRKEE